MVAEKMQFSSEAIDSDDFDSCSSKSGWRQVFGPRWTKLGMRKVHPAMEGPDDEIVDKPLRSHPHCHDDVDHRLR